MFYSHSLCVSLTFFFGSRIPSRLLGCIELLRMSLSAHPGCDSLLDLPCRWWPWQSSAVLITYVFCSMFLLNCFCFFFLIKMPFTYHEIHSFKVYNRLNLKQCFGSLILLNLRFMNNIRLLELYTKCFQIGNVLLKFHLYGELSCSWWAFLWAGLQCILAKGNQKVILGLLLPWKCWKEWICSGILDCFGHCSSRVLVFIY